MQTPDDGPRPSMAPRAAMRIIALALILGQIAFAGVVLWLLETRGPLMGRGDGDEAKRVLSLVAIGFAVLSVPMAWLCNGVLLPDTKILVITGEKYSTTNGCAMVPALEPELFDPATLTWVTLAAGTIIRDYHNTALLLPSGKVWTAGGESRRYQVIPPPSPPVCLNTPLPSGAQADFQLFAPHYLNCGNVQPVILNPPAHGSQWTWTRGSTPLVQHQAFPDGALLSIDKVVLTRPGSVTHHSDGNQRCVQLDFTVVATNPPTLQVTVPSASLGILPRGYYMLWLVTNQGTPSQAVWVKVTG